MKPGLKSRLLALISVALLGSSLAQAKNKKLQVPDVFQTAHTIYVESIDGEISKPGLSHADHDAILQVQEAIREWNRYTLADSRTKADLIVVVRKGHKVGDQDHLGLGVRPLTPQPVAEHPGARIVDNHPTDPNGSVGNGGDDIAMQDLLRVYTLNEKGKLKGPVWSRDMENGLSGPTVRLVMDLKAAVEITYPRETASPQSASQPTQ